MTARNAQPNHEPRPARGPVGHARFALPAALLTGLAFLSLPCLEMLSSVPVKGKRATEVEPVRMPAPPPRAPERSAPDRPREGKHLPKPVLRPEQARPVPISAALNVRMALGDLGGSFDLDFPTAPDALLNAPESAVFELREVDEPPQPLAQWRPDYPVQARQQGREGAVVVEFVVDVNGETRDIKSAAAQAEDLFFQAARRAIRRWRFKPAIRNGKPVPARVRQKVIFKLE